MNKIKDIRRSVDIRDMYVSMPLHKATINVAVIDENSIVPKEVKIRSKTDNLREFSYSIPSGSDTVIKSSST